MKQSPRADSNSRQYQSCGKRTGLCVPPHSCAAAFLCAACAPPGEFVTWEKIVISYNKKTGETLWKFAHSGISSPLQERKT